MPSFLFYVCVRFASNLCEGKPREVLSSRVGVFLDNSCRAKSESKVLAPKQKCKNLMRQKSGEKIKEANFRSKKIQKRKNFSSLSCCLVGGVVVVSHEQLFNESIFRERKSINNGNANASFVSTNDATKINATKQHSKIIVEKENI